MMYQLPQPYINPKVDFEFLFFVNYRSKTERTFWATRENNLPRLEWLLCKGARVFILTNPRHAKSLTIVTRAPGTNIVDRLDRGESNFCCGCLFIFCHLECLTRVGRYRRRFYRGFESFRTRWSILSRTRPVPFRRRADDETVVITGFPIVPSDEVCFVRQNSDVHKCYEKQQTNQNVCKDPQCYRHGWQFSYANFSP